jgi:hypothetical protein
MQLSATPAEIRSRFGENADRIVFAFNQQKYEEGQLHQGLPGMTIEEVRVAVADPDFVFYSDQIYQLQEKAKEVKRSGTGADIKSLQDRIKMESDGIRLIIKNDILVGYDTAGKRLKELGADAAALQQLQKAYQQEYQALVTKQEEAYAPNGRHAVELFQAIHYIEYQRADYLRLKAQMEAWKTWGDADANRAAAQSKRDAAAKAMAKAENDLAALVKQGRDDLAALSQRIAKPSPKAVVAAKEKAKGDPGLKALWEKVGHDKTNPTFVDEARRVVSNGILQQERDRLQADIAVLAGYDCFDEARKLSDDLTKAAKEKLAEQPPDVANLIDLEL